MPRAIVWIPPVLALALFSAASAVTAIYYGDTWAISYTTAVSPQLLWQHRAGLSLGTLRQAWSTPQYEAAFLATVIAWPLLLRSRSRRASWVAASLPLLLLCPLNLIGALVVLADLVAWPGWDGETLAEGWPLLEVYGLWSSWAAAWLVCLSLKERRHVGGPNTADPCAP